MVWKSKAKHSLAKTAWKGRSNSDKQRNTQKWRAQGKQSISLWTLPRSRKSVLVATNICINSWTIAQICAGPCSQRRNRIWLKGDYSSSSPSRREEHQLLIYSVQWRTRKQETWRAVSTGRFGYSVRIHLTELSTIQWTSWATICHRILQGSSPIEHGKSPSKPARWSLGRSSH